MKSKNLHIAIFSTLFAAAMWLSINLSYEYQTVISVPLALENIKPNRALARPVPASLAVKVHTSGWELLGLYFVPNVRYVLDVADVTNKFNFITNKDVMERLKIPQSIHPVEIKPDTVIIVLDEKIKKIVPVEPEVQMSFRDGYDIVGEIKTTPDSVTLTGAKAILDKVEQWQTKPLVFSNLRSDVNTRVAVTDSLEYGVTPFPAAVDLQFAVQPTAEKTFKGISVEVDQVPNNRLVVLIPPKIDVIVRGGIGQLATVDRKDLSSYIDYRTILLDTTGSIEPVVTTPKNIRVVKKDPERLQYVVRK
ncbi:MAG TPA: CdaR family protein [Bacteroidota bacterium]|nr:CdaR family protein [Bacteroidota bacterium]